MRPKSGLRVLLFAIAIAFGAAGCGHLPMGNGATTGGSTAPVTLTFHDTPTSGVVVTSFEATVTGAVLQPGNVSLLSAPGQTIELTQLQANSAFLSTTKVSAATYNSLTITYANPKYTILNNTGAPLTIFTKVCGAGQSCVVTPTGGTLTNMISTFLVGTPPTSGSLVIGAGQPTLLEMDINLNTVVQPDFTVNFGLSGAVSATQLQTSGTTSVIDTLSVSGAVTALGTNQFTLAPMNGAPIVVPVVTGTTQFDFQRANCTANNFTCMAVGQIVNVELNILGSGAFQAAEVDFDDTPGSQEVSGTIVALGAGTPPASFQMVIHNTSPALSTVPTGTPATVTVGTGATFVINNGLFALPSGSFNFASAANLLVGQEVEARVSGSVTPGPPAAFTAARFALGQSQFNATVNQVFSPSFSVTFTNLASLFSAPGFQIQATTTNQTVFQTQSTTAGTFNDVSGLVNVQGGVFLGGFLFNSANPNTPNLVTVTVRRQVNGT